MSRDKGDIRALQDRAMTALARYGYLTLPQMQRLKVGVIGNSRPEMNLLIDWKYVKVLKYTTTDLRKHPYWYFLTPLGASIYQDRNREVTDIVYPKHTRDVVRMDYLHRVNFVDTWISYDEWIAKNNHTTEFFYPYYHFRGKERATKLHLNDGSVIVPDGVLCFNKGKQRLYHLEVFRGDNTKNIVDKAAKISQAIAQGVAAIHYKKETAERGLFTFEHEGTMKATMSRILESDIYKKGLEDYLFFALAKDVQTDFGKWIKLTGEVVDLALV
ncbi:MAG: replication-relaxation family protein [Saprospiraceae bacterium]|nr:replication-relaxation family protein [Saprospiraceae bacterium]